LGAAILRFFFILLAFAVVRGGCDSGPSPTRVAHQAATRAALREAARPINQLRQPPTASPRTEGAQASAVWRRVFPTAVAPAPTAPQVELSDAPDWLRTFCKTARRGKCQRANGVWAAFRSGDCARAKRRYAWLSNDMMLAPELRTALKRGGRIIQTTCAASP
jgi:hypothetical protein